MKVYIQTYKATTNIFGRHTQPRKTTRYTKKLKLVWALSWPNLFACQFSWQSDNVNSNFNYKNLQVGGKEKEHKS